MLSNKGVLSSDWVKFNELILSAHPNVENV